MKNMYFNLTQMLQGCSKRNGMTVSASNPDGEPTVNRQSRLMSLSGKKAEKEQLSPSCLLSASFPLSFRSRYLRYAAMIFCVLALSIGQAWGTPSDTVTVHTPGKVAEGGLITKWGKKYEVYYSNNGGTANLLVGSNTSSTTQAAGANKWVQIEGGQGSDNNISTAFTLAEFVSNIKTSNNKTLKIQSTAKAYKVSMVVSGYDSIALLGKSNDINVYAEIYDKGSYGAQSVLSEGHTSNASSHYKRQFALDKTKQYRLTIAFGTSGTTNRYLVAFSLCYTPASCAAADLTASNITSNGDQEAGTGITFSKVGTPASGDTWYWQTSATGTDKTYNATSPYTTATTTGSYTVYLRAFNTDCWGTAASMTNTIYPAPSAMIHNTFAVNAAWGSTIATQDKTNITGLNAMDAVGESVGSGSNKSGLTQKIPSQSSEDADKYMSLSFNVASGKQLNVTSVVFDEQPVENIGTFKVSISDNQGSATKTQTIASGAAGSKHTLTLDGDIVGSFKGIVTVKVWAYGWSDGYRFGNYFYIHGTVTDAAACTAPSSVPISGDYAYLGGQTISLTATPTGHTGTPQYQWQKETSTDVWEDISGATSATFTKSNCGYGDSGNYRCVVSTGATCSTTSPGYGVHVYSLSGGYVGEDWEQHDLTVQSGTTGIATVHLNAGSLYKFKITSNNGKWYGNGTADYNGDGNADDTDDGWYTLGNISEWTFNESGKNFRLYTGIEGDYTFTVDVENGMSGSVKVSVTYPTPTSHPAAGLAYLEKPSGWTNVYLYWYGDDSYRLTNWDGAPEITATTLICGTTYYYTPLGTSFGNVIFKGNDGNQWTSISTSGCSGKYLDQTTYESPAWASFTTYTISFNAGGGEGTMSSITDICPNADQLLPANAFEKTGYTFAGWKDASDNEYVDEATIEDISNDITLTAQWEVAASLTAISADTLYQAASMANITFTGSDQNFTGLSTNHLFKVYGTDGNAAKGKTVSSTSITDDIGSKSFTSLAYIMPADNLSSESDPTKGAIEIITPSTAGLLYVYTNNASTNLKLKKKGQNSTTALSGTKYKAVEVEANTHYFIVNDGGNGNREIYGIQYVSTYGVTITTTNVTKGDGSATAIKGKAYTATFTAETGYTLPSDVTVTIGGVEQTKGTGYTWIVSSGTGTLTVPAAKVTGAINISVVGSAPAGHTVTYNYNGATGGTGTPSATGASVTLPNPTRTDYTFDGWYTTEGTKVGIGGATYNPTADITLYARWEEECAVVGGSGSTKIIGFTTATCSEKASSGGERTLSNVSNLTVAHEIHDGGDGDDSLMVNTEAKVAMYYGSNSKVYSRGAYRWIKGLSSLGKSNNTVGFSTTVGSEYQFTIDSISFGIGASANFTYQIIIYQSGDTLYKSPIRTVTNYNSSSSTNHEFHVNGLSAQTKLQNLTGTFYVRVRVCQASTGKYFYLPMFQVIGNLHESGGGGGIGTCYHVYYKGNGADEGFVADTTSYADGEEVTVLDYDDSRYPLAKDGYEFSGWATSAGGSVAYSAGDKITIDGADVTLHAVWVAESDALVTWKMKTADDEAWATTTDTGTTDETNITSISTAHDEGDNKAKNPATAKTAMASGEVSSTAAPDKSARFTFTIAGGKQVEINKFDCKVYNVSSGNRTYKAQISDAAGNVYNSTNKVAVSAEATLTDASFVFGSGKILRGAVTIRIYAWDTDDSKNPTEFRMGPDVKFYGTVEDYACATPDAPTISGVSEYVPGQTITLTASHDGENYDNLTTYTWYKGDTWGDKSKVQDPATGESGYTLTIDECTTGNAGLYWCEVSNGTGCDAHNSEGYDVTVYPTYTITYNLNEGDWGEVKHKDSYTQFDEDYTLPTPTKTGFVFAGWYGASDFSGLPTVVLGAGSVGNKEYWAKWGASVTVSWTVTKVDGELYRGGGGYSVKAVINEPDWRTGFMDELELTATEGVTLKNIEVSENDESKVQVTADFDITTDLAADATSITFTLDVPADGTYGPKVDEHEEDLDDCGGGASGYTEFFSMIPKANTCSITNTEANSAPNHFTTCECTSSATITAGGSVTYGFYSSGTGTTSKYWEYNGGNGGWKHSTANSWVVLYSTDQFKAGDSIVITNGNSSSSGYYTIVASASNNTADYHSVSQVAAPSTTTPAKNTNYYYKLPASFVSSNYLVIRSSTTSSCYVGTIKAYHAGAVGGVTPTLTWDDGDADIANDGVSKSTSNDDFVYTARQDKNSLGAITYSSSDATVATVNATTGQVHLVGAAGTATITATIAASGCFSSANVSYTITVTDDCDDEAGTIETEDLGCSGVKMTVKGHTAAAGVSYQWYKVETPSDAIVGTDQDNFTATEAGSYYVIVTNTGDRHCAKRSTNTITVEAQAAATATKIVDSWYVKNGRRTPDIELVKTTNATSFTVTSGSITIWESAGSTKTGFGGCGFHMDENGIIYLNGTKDDDGSATTGLIAGDETLTITAIGCGSSASQNITIHKQAATTYKEIAFVADGGKGMKKDSITVGHGDGTELYEYLDSVGTAAGKRLFQLSERNIYWTTDEKAIREEYSQFDAILITDDPSTNTVVKTGDDYKTKGYVNAFGTMVDVRPIFTMEAYVSALKNWKTKGIAGAPESPNPRQYEMRLECKDHEIYDAGLPEPSDGTNVWEETIGGETFRHVILVDSTKGVYKGVAYNTETAGNKKPALQGFTSEAAGSLLGLGRILEGTLQAAIERQEEPAARLLVMGINAKALQPTCALTNEGKAVIKNILVYLLKTNMEEVDDCSNYFTGKTNDLWSEPSNWSKRVLPSSEAKVRILAPCVISGIQPHVLQVSIVNRGNSNIRNNATGSAVCDGTLTIEPDGALIVAGKIRAAEAPYFTANDLKPTTPEMLTINTGSTAQAALIFDNEDGDTKATVNLYSLGSKPSSYQYQYFAVPMEVVPVNPTFANETHGGTGIYTYVYSEASSGWTRRGYYDDLYAFEGLGITTKSTGAMNYTMTGNLASTATKEITLTHADEGLNLIGNSWMAPIQIGALAEDNAGLDNQTVYIYCAGRDAEGGAVVSSDGTETAGQWLAIPFSASEFDTWKAAGKLSVIPAMQAFEINVSAEATLTLDYDKVVRGSANDLNAKLRAPGRRIAANEVTMTNIRVADSKTHTDLSLFEGDRFSEAFDNGWEAEYMDGDGRSAKLYAETEAGQMAVAAMYDYEGTVVGFAPGQETEYTFSFMGEDNGYYLNDIKLKNSVRISEGETYTFIYEEGDAANRFYISRTAINAPEVATGMENLDAAAPRVQKIIYNDKLYIIRGGRLYDATGKVVK